MRMVGWSGLISSCNGTRMSGAKFVPRWNQVVVPQWTQETNATYLVEGECMGEGGGSGEVDLESDHLSIRKDRIRYVLLDHRRR